MFGLGKKSYPTGATRPGQRIPITSPSDARIARLEKQLAAANARYDELQMRYNLLWELNQKQANTIDELRGATSYLEGDDNGA